MGTSAQGVRKAKADPCLSVEGGDGLSWMKPQVTQSLRRNHLEMQMKGQGGA
jgi:hypothetical protein